MTLYGDSASFSTHSIQLTDVKKGVAPKYLSPPPLPHELILRLCCDTRYRILELGEKICLPSRSFRFGHMHRMQPEELYILSCEKGPGRIPLSNRSRISTNRLPESIRGNSLKLIRTMRIVCGNSD